MRIPRIIRSTEQLKDAGDGGSLATAKTNFHALAERQAPGGGNLVAQFGDDDGGGGEAGVEIEADLAFVHAEKRAELPKIGRPG